MLGDPLNSSSSQPEIYLQHLREGEKKILKILQRITYKSILNMSTNSEST